MTETETRLRIEKYHVNCYQNETVLDSVHMVLSDGSQKSIESHNPDKIMLLLHILESGRSVYYNTVQDYVTTYEQEGE